MDWQIREELHIRKEQEKSTNQNNGSYQLPQTRRLWLLAVRCSNTWRTVVPMKAAAVAKMWTIYIETKVVY